MPPLHGMGFFALKFDFLPKKALALQSVEAKGGYGVRAMPFFGKVLFTPARRRLFQSPQNVYMCCHLEFRRLPDMIDRITILGGSSVYIPELILSIISRNLNVQEIVLLGNSEAKLKIVAAFCQRVLKRSGYPTLIIPTTDIAEAVKGAKYILNHVRVGGMEARMRDEMLPPKFGMLGHESLGAGGIVNALRTMPVVFEHAKIIQETNPEAIYINLCNPMGIIMEGLIKYTSLNCMGISDLPGNYIQYIATILNQEGERLQFDYIGLNHLGWIQDVKVGASSKMSYLLEILEKREEEDFDYELIELFRMIPTRHTGMYFHQAEVLKKQKSGVRFRAEILHEAEKQILKL